MRQVLLSMTMFFALTTSIVGYAGEGVNLNPAFDVRSTLEYIKKQGVNCSIRTKSGHDYSGAKLGEISEHAVILKGYGNYQYYDVYLPLAEIVAVEVKVRGNR